MSGRKRKKNSTNFDIEMFNYCLEKLKIPQLKSFHSFNCYVWQNITMEYYQLSRLPTRAKALSFYREYEMYALSVTSEKTMGQGNKDGKTTHQIKKKKTCHEEIIIHTEENFKIVSRTAEEQQQRKENENDIHSMKDAGRIDFGEIEQESVNRNVEITQKKKIRKEKKLVNIDEKLDITSDEQQCLKRKENENENETENYMKDTVRKNLERKEQQSVNKNKEVTQKKKIYHKEENLLNMEKDLEKMSRKQQNVNLVESGKEVENYIENIDTKCSLKKERKSANKDEQIAQKETTSEEK